MPSPLHPPALPGPALAPPPERRAGLRRLRLLIEPLLLVAVLLGLAAQFDGLQGAPGGDASGDGRYLEDRALQPAALAAPVAALLTDVGLVCQLPDLPPRLRWRWSPVCPATVPANPAASPGSAGVVQALADATQRDYLALQAAITRGELDRLARSAVFSRSLGEGVLPADDRRRLEALTDELARYRLRYQLAPNPDTAGGGARSALPLACAWRELSARADGANRAAAQAVVAANRLALVQGQAARLWWPPAAGLGGGDGWSPGTASACSALGPAEAVMADAATLARQVIRGPAWAHKAQAMLNLLANAPALLAGWALLTWLLLKGARVSGQPARHLGGALLAWSVAGIPLWWWQPVAPSAPAWAWAAVGPALGLLCLVAARPLSRSVLLAPAPRLINVSPLTLPLAVGFIGLGWWLVIDLSVHGHPRNRYLALDQARAVFWALAVLSVVPLLAPGLATLGLRIASRLTGAARSVAGRPAWQRAAVAVLLGGVLLSPLAVAMAVPGNLRQVTGDLFRWALLPVMAWFFLVRGEQWTLAAAGGPRRLLRSMAPPLLFIAATLGALVLTDDQGPALVTMLTAAVYLGALASQSQLGAGRRWPLAAGVGLATAALATTLMVGALIELPSRLGGLPGLEQRMARFAERVAGMTDPYTAENDQSAHVQWFRQHIPPGGHGLGAVPWCGSLAASGCQGMPAQTQSDYSFTALQGVVGEAGGFALLGLYLVPWLGALALRQARWTSGRLASAPGHNPVAALAWLAVCWVCMVTIQTLVTAAGNLGALPLTGVTWPFVSFGFTSLVGSSVWLGLVMHRLETPA